MSGPDFEGTDRYRPVRLLGEGGMGQVYEVHDAVAGRRVALKTLQSPDPMALFLFKNEFRALADLAHPHLVGLHELGFDGERPFFTMELVEDAVDLLRYARGPSHSSGRSWLTAAGDLDPDATLPPQFAMPEELRPPGDLPDPTPLDAEMLGQLPHLLGQLAEAIAALHTQRKLHRDVKPSNVLVTPDRRVVLVDFGLVASLEPEHVAHRGMIAGSVPYMSPEQSLGAELTPASDWYAFGAVLYELLTGRPPFAGARAAVLAAKRGRDVVPPSLVVPGVPDALDALCVALLAAEPDARPSGREILHALGREAPLERARNTLIGRESHIAALAQSMSALRDGHTRTVHVRGHSGMGKSALTAAFLDAQRARGDVLVLSARCYERDNVPFKAVDPLIDALVPWLTSLPHDEVAALAPRHIRALARLFPVLDRVPALAEGGGRTARAKDPYEDQRRAFDALRELFARVGERRPLVVAIDDLQWADRDSAEILRGLLRPPDPPTMLLLLAYRTEALDTSLALRWLAPPEEEHIVVVGPLGSEHAEQVVRQIHADVEPETLAQIVGEAQGSPFFITELAHRAKRYPSEKADLDALILGRVAELPTGARRLLDAIALSSVPIRRGVAMQAAGSVSTTAVTVLQSSRLIQSEGPGRDHRLECYHDRIRETVLPHIADAPQLHLALAEALERHGGADAELLCTHLVEAGQPKRAIRYAREAAADAAEALAFDRAAANLRMLLQLLGPDHDERGLVLARLGEALANAGRGREAAEARLAAAPLVRDPKLRRKAAVNYLWAGELETGRALMVDVLSEHGLRMPRSRWGLLAMGLWHRLLSRLRPLRFRPRPIQDLDEQEVEQAYAIAEMGLAIVVSDQELAFATLARFVTHARRLGHASLFVTAMAAESFIAHLEPWGIQRGERAYQLGLQVARHVEDPLPLAWLYQYNAITLIQIGDSGRAVELLEHSMEKLAQVPDAIMWSGWVRMFLAIFAGHRDSWQTYVDQFYVLVADAEARGDLTLEIHSVLGSAVHPGLILDDPDEVDRHVEAVFAKWQQDDFDLMHFYCHIQRLVVLSYRGAYADALALLREVTPRMRGSGALNSGANITQWTAVTVAVTAGAVLDGLATPAGIRSAKKMVRADAHSRGWRRAMASWAGCALYTALGEKDAALALVDLGVEAARGEGMKNLRLCLEIQRHRALGDVDGEDFAAMVEEARATGLRDPLRFIDAYGPIRVG